MLNIWDDLIDFLESIGDIGAVCILERSVIR
jgi:hypothetical protein